jgi:hypothetical protein
MLLVVILTNLYKNNKKILGIILERPNKFHKMVAQEMQKANLP